MVDWYDDVILPKLWTEVVRRWWDVTVPTDYPTDTGVEFGLDFGDNKDAVEEMESSLNTEESVITDYIPKNTFVQEYLGVFEAEGEGGEQVLLSPQRVPTAQAFAIHYNSETETWDNVENVNVVDGYAYGDLSSLSPIAVFAVRKEIVESDTAIEPLHAIVANGNPIKVISETTPVDGGDDVVTIFAVNTISGKKFEIDPSVKTLIIGGTADGDYLKEASVAVDGVEDENLYVYCGSCGSDEFTAKVGTAKAFVKNSKIAAVTGSHYRVRTGKVVINIQDSYIKSHIATGQSWYTAKKKDSNTANPDDTSDFITYEAEINLKNTYCELVFAGGNSGYTYTKKSTIKAEDSKLDWYIAGSSNGRIDDASIEAKNCQIKITQTTNRGTVGTGSITLTGSTVVTDGIYLAGDASDKTVTGTVDVVICDIDKGVSGTLFLGTNGGEVLTDNARIKSVKVSRSADVVIADEIKKVLGEKLKIK